MILLTRKESPANFRWRTRSESLIFCNKILLGIFSLFLSLTLSAQFTVTVQLQSTPIKHINDAAYIAGSFNNWNPADEAYKLKQNNSLVFKLMEGTYEFKVTRGSWGKVECTDKGADIANRSIRLTSDTVILLSITGWKDDFFHEKAHTKSERVQLFSEDFEMPLLGKKRHIWVYLPPGYDDNGKRFPVMYMQDGQNVFDEYTAPFGEWGVDECLDSLIAEGKPGCIVVAIETGGLDRMSEYNPYLFTYRGQKDTITFSPKADEYLVDIIKTLKPSIDKKYRTLHSSEHTIITGSSMGGVLAYYAAIKYPGVFGKAGIFSPAFWTASGIDSLTNAHAQKLTGKYFFYMGGKEGDTDLDNMKRICTKAGENSAAMIYMVVDPEGEHKEKYWRQWFPEFYNWIIADGYNVINNSRH